MFAQIISGAALIFLTALITWLFSRKKQRSEIAKLDIENMISLVKFWKTSADDLQAVIANMEGQVVKLRAEVYNLRRENAVLKNELAELRKLLKSTSKP